jgi:hypothetical protein
MATVRSPEAACEGYASRILAAFVSLRTVVTTLWPLARSCSRMWAERVSWWSI